MAQLDDGLDYVEESEQLGTFAETVMQVMGAIALTFGAIITAIGDAAGGVVVRLLTAFGVGGESWIYAFTRAPAQYIQESFNIGAQGFSETAFSQLGPFLPWIATIVSIGVVAMVTWYLDRRNSDVPGLGLNLPVIGNDEDEVDAE